MLGFLLVIVLPVLVCYLSIAHQFKAEEEKKARWSTLSESEKADIRAKEIRDAQFFPMLGAMINGAFRFFFVSFLVLALIGLFFGKR